MEDLFEAGLLKVVFATETLALGINMPARTVVLETLSKFNGETHELMRPGDYTQLTGRAGRRGIDVEGYGVVLHSPFVRFGSVTEVASIGSHPLRSSFRPTYNMTANLVANYGQEQAEELLEASFAAFQREGDKHAADTTIEALEHSLQKEESAADCERGPWRSTWRSWSPLSQRATTTGSRRFSGQVRWWMSPGAPATDVM